ncbi:hypothetical protein JQR88_04070 [Pseudomonas luteola]|uniref:hypothetical protein n=1 Tax=Pseudomonas luteola TaxID=47886 RepID=UPI003DA01886
MPRKNKRIACFLAVRAARARAALGMIWLVHCLWLPGWHEHSPGNLSGLPIQAGKPDKGARAGLACPEDISP